MAWFREIDSLFSLIQIGLDLCLIGVMVFVLKKRSRDLFQADRITATISQVLDETRTLAEGFEVNLKERQNLITQLLDKLDRRIEEAVRLHSDLEAMQRRLLADHPLPNSSEPASQRHSEQRLIQQLAHQGLPAKAIAERLKKPLGEVELVLNLRTLADRG